MAGAAGIPGDVKRFVDRCVTSVEQLELLLLLRREPERRWNAEEAALKLHTATHSVGVRFAELVSGKLAARDGDAVHYAASREIDAVVEQLERFYGTHRTRIIGMIFDKPAGPVRDFADAFRLRKDD